jgi:hypothetical protein
VFFEHGVSAGYAAKAPMKGRLKECAFVTVHGHLKRSTKVTKRGSFFVTTKVARLETTKTRSHKGTKKRKSFEILDVLSVFAPLW